MEQMIILGAVYCSILFFLVKKPWVTKTLSVQKQTDNGETVVLSTNFSTWDTGPVMKRKADELFRLADDRLAYVDARFKAQLAAAEAEQTQQPVRKLK